MPEEIEVEDIDLILPIGIPVTGYLVPRIVPVLNEEKVVLIEIVPTILVLLEPEQYEDSLFDLMLMSVSPYYEANLGDQVFFPIDSGDASSLKRESEGTIPKGTSGNLEFVSALTVEIYVDELQVDIVPNQQSITVSFIIPEELIGREFVILYWDETLNSGLGGWVEIEMTILYWDTRLESWIDKTTLNSAVNYVTEGRAIATADFTGTFVLMVLDSTH